jgi:hypothetical protein
MPGRTPPRSSHAGSGSGSQPGSRSRSQPGSRSPWAAALLGAALAAAIPVSGCTVVRRFSGPQLTGTCDGACAHYVQCKPGHSEADGRRCRAECPEVFSDGDSLMTYESLSCDNAVEFVDGPAKTAAHR